MLPVEENVVYSQSNSQGWGLSSFSAGEGTQLELGRITDVRLDPAGPSTVAQQGSSSSSEVSAAVSLEECGHFRRHVGRSCDIVWARRTLLELGFPEVCLNPAGPYTVAQEGSSSSSDVSFSCQGLCQGRSQSGKFQGLGIFLMLGRVQMPDLMAEGPFVLSGKAPSAGVR